MEHVLPKRKGRLSLQENDSQPFGELIETNHAQNNRKYKNHTDRLLDA
jgi:hypothetical protein